MHPHEVEVNSVNNRIELLKLIVIFCYGLNHYYHYASCAVV